MKRVLLKGIAELEERWDLKRLDADKRFLKEGKGRWTVLLERKPQRSRKVISESSLEPVQPLPQAIPSADSSSLVTRLTSRGIGPAAADELADGYPQTDVCTMIELYDWYNQRGQARGPGFLVGAIKNPSTIVFPKGFESSVSVAAKKAAEKNRISSERDFRTQREREHAERQNVRQSAFLAFWQNLSPVQQEDFEREALDAAEPTKKAGYLRAMGKGINPVFEQYRSIILRDHFERTHGISDKPVAGL